MIKGWAYRPARHGRRGASRKTGGGGGAAGASTGGAGMPAGAMTGGAGMPAGSGAATAAGAACCGVLGAAGAAMAGAGMAMPTKAGAKAGGGGPKRGTAPGKAPRGSRLDSLCCTSPAAKASRVAVSGISGRGGTVPRLGKGTPAPGGAVRPSVSGPQARSQNFATAWPGSVWQPASISASSAQSCA
jgi:hypothetical protein